MCQGQGLDGKGSRSYKKEVKNKEGKEEGEMVEHFKNHSISCARGRVWMARAENNTRRR